MAFEGERLVRTRAVRLCAKEYDKELLISLTITPETLKKAATRGMMKVKWRELQPPEPVLYPTNEDPDEKAVQDYHEQHPEGSDEEEYTPSDPGRAHEAEDEQVAKKPRLEVLEDKGSSSSGAMDASQQKELKIHPPREGGSEEQPAYKRSEETLEHTANAARTGMYSPTFAGDIRQVQEHYVDEQADLLEEWQFDEESHPELDIEMDFSEKLIDREKRDGPPIVSDEMLAQLDREATLEEIERPQKLEVLAVADLRSVGSGRSR